MQFPPALYIELTEKERLLITGGAGFIGSHVVRLFVNKYPEYTIVNGDSPHLCR